MDLLEVPPAPGAALDAFWSACAGAGAASVELDLWRWLYAHPGAAPDQAQEALLAAARGVWNRWFAPAFGCRDALVLGTPGDLASSRLGLADHPLGWVIALQLQARQGPSARLGETLPRLAHLGSLTPDLWLERAGAGPLDPGVLMRAAEADLARLE